MTPRTLLLIGMVLWNGCSPTRPTLTPTPPGAILTAVEERIYRIGPEDVLSILLDATDMDSAVEVIVRSDGAISLPRLNDVTAADLTPMELRQTLDALAAKVLGHSTTTAVIVKEIHSRKIYVMGNVKLPGVFPLVGPITVLQALALAGGFGEWAKTKQVEVVRDVGGEWLQYYAFSYRAIEQHKRMHDILLRPGDVIVVP